ncbi:MAG: hypothetical protein ACXVZX_10860 [Terriglobales bacterium]
MNFIVGQNPVSVGSRENTKRSVAVAGIVQVNAKGEHIFQSVGRCMGVRKAFNVIIDQHSQQP